MNDACTIIIAFCNKAKCSSSITLNFQAYYLNFQISNLTPKTSKQVLPHQSEHIKVNFLYIFTYYMCMYMLHKVFVQLR